MQDKKVLLESLKQKMLLDKSLPLMQGNTNLVFGGGNPDADVLFIGEGPGFHEDRLGIPFVGAAGQLLNKLLDSVNIPRADVYITNVVHYRPPQNRDPLPEEIKAFTPYLDQIISIIQPKIISTLGRFSMAKFLPSVKISGVHGKVHNIKYQPAQDKTLDFIVIPMYHPAAALRNGQIMNQIKIDFQNIPQALENIQNLEKEQQNKVTQEGLF